MLPFYTSLKYLVFFLSFSSLFASGVELEISSKIRAGGRAVSSLEDEDVRCRRRVLPCCLLTGCCSIAFWVLNSFTQTPPLNVSEKRPEQKTATLRGTPVHVSDSALSSTATVRYIHYDPYHSQWLEGVPLWHWDAELSCQGIYKKAGLTSFYARYKNWRNMYECREEAYEKALKEAIDKDDAYSTVAKFRLAIVYYRQENTAAYLKLIRSSAEEGYDEAQIKLAWTLNPMESRPRSHRTNEHYVEALEWAKKAALQGNPRAAGYVAGYYLTDKSLEDHEKIAVDWMHKGVWDSSGFSTKDQVIAHQIGKMYLSGVEVPKDQKRAAYWFEKARMV